MNLSQWWFGFALALSFVTPAFADDGKTASTGPWDIKALQAVDVKPDWGKSLGGAREVYYAGEYDQRKSTRVFAYFAKPAKGTGPFPAVLLVHGGGGKAFPKWAEHWAGRGYCALAMDLSGHGPDGKLPDGGPDQSDEVKFRDFTAATVRDMWTYHAVAAVVRGHNLLRALPEVDKDRVAVTGISWGGYLTCIVAGLDDRLKAAVPVYGCGFLHENSFWKEQRFDNVPVDRRDRWVAAFDPSRYLARVQCPMLFLNGTNDFAYPLDSYQKSYGLVSAPRTVSVRVRLNHGHIWTFGEVDAFIDSHLGNGKPLTQLSGLNRDGEAVSATVKGAVPVKSAHLHYAAAEGPWQKREWRSTDAECKDGRVNAKLPSLRPLVYFLAVTDDRGLEVSTTHEILAANQAPNPTPASKPFVSVPDTVSKEARDYLMSLPGPDARPAAPAPNDLAAWKQAWQAREAERLPLSEAAVKRYGPAVTEHKLGGVPVLDIKPKGWKESREVLVYTHGGAYTFLSARSSLLSAVTAADATGRRVISIDYTVAPTGKWDAVTDEVVTVIDALRTEGHSLKNIAIYGDSAGGGLAGGAVLKMRDKGRGMPAAIVLWSPWADITDSGDSAVTLKAAEPTYLYDRHLKNSAAAYADPKDQKHPYVSPVYGDFTKGFPPTLIQGGTKEIFLSHFVRLYQAIDQAGSVATLDLYEGMPHVFQPRLADAPEGKSALRKMRSFLDRHLGR